MGLSWWSTVSSLELGLARLPVKCEDLRHSLPSPCLLVPLYLPLTFHFCIHEMRTHQGFQSGHRDQMGGEAGQGSQGCPGGGWAQRSWLASHSLPCQPGPSWPRIDRRASQGHCFPRQDASGLPQHPLYEMHTGSSATPFIPCLKGVALSPKERWIGSFLLTEGLESQRTFTNLCFLGASQYL